jgi:hypothetical protein
MAETNSSTSGKSFWLKRYPPLILLVLAVMAVAIYLPSALNLPQSNPSTVLEYAPVPPDDEAPPSTEGSISALGLGSSGSLTTDRPPPPQQQQQQTETAESDRPTVKRCVGNPPRQTEDPNAPPCVAFFDGDNGGTTWQGVTGDEITVLIYHSAYLTTGGESSPFQEYCDIDKPPNTDPGCLDDSHEQNDVTPVRAARALSRYFNDRFQTYNRHVHFWIYFTSSSSSPSQRRADAADNWETLQPFAVMDQAFFGGHNEIYAESMVKRRTMVFGAFSLLRNSYYRTYAPMIWSFWPDVEHMADMYVSYICEKIAPYNTKHAGDDKQSVDMNGKPRKYGLLSTTDPNWASLQYFAELAEQGIRTCAPKGSIVAERTYSRNQYQTDTHPDAPQEAASNIAQFQSRGVTTILWLGGYEAEHSEAADRAEYYPEWIFTGDGLMEGHDNAQNQNQEVWRHAWGITNTLRVDREEDDPARQAYREAEPQGDDTAEETAVELYRHFFTMFKAIQVAGPYLTPSAVDQGQHSIPRQKSENPYIAACFYDPGDFTCVKDAQEIWWDPDAPSPFGGGSNDPEQRGCYRMVRGGERYLAGTWEGTDADVFSKPNDVCTLYDSATFLNPYGPEG